MAVGRGITLALAIFACINTVLGASLGSQYEKDTFRRQLANEVRSYMDQRADPCRDIYQYACGNFDKVVPLPPGETRITFGHVASKKIEADSQELLASISDRGDEGSAASPQLKMKHFHESCMDQQTRTTRGIEPFLQFTRKLGGWPLIDARKKASRISKEHLLAATSLYSKFNIIKLEIMEDFFNATQYIVEITQPDTFLLTKNEVQLGYNSPSTKIYENIIVGFLKLLGVSSEDANRYVAQIIDFELKIVDAIVDTEGPATARFYTKLTFGELVEQYPGFDWDKFFLMSTGQKFQKDVVLALYPAEYLQRVIPVLQGADPEVFANFVWMKVLFEVFNYMDSRFIGHMFESLAPLTGSSTPLPIEQRCDMVLKGNFGNVVGGMYARKFLTEETRQQVRSVLEDIRAEFLRMIHEKQWLREPTKLDTIHKLADTTIFVGYDEKVVSEEALEKAFSNINIDKEKYFENMISLTKLNQKKLVNKLGTVVRTTPAFPPTTFNAAYASPNNHVEIEAGFLQPPNYHKYYPMAFIYAAVGSFVGHEFGHSMDTVGGKFDQNGSLRKWWDDTSLAEFNERSQCFIKQYGNYTFHGNPVNGALTITETMADNSGLRAAFNAYKKWWEENKNTELARDETLPGLPFDNFGLFFLKYAQNWCETVLPAAAPSVLQDIHPPHSIRLQGTFANHPEFSSQFRCRPSSNCLVW